MSRRNPGLFVGYWFDADGHRLRRLSRSELAMLYRLRARHADIRTARNPAAKRWGALPIDEETP
jgi:hypothetical protein